MLPQANGKAVRQKSAFRMQVAVSIAINAAPERVWALLTNAGDFPRWNSTIQQIEGRIDKGEKIKVRATIAPKRTFALTVSVFVPNERMVWQQGAAPMFKGVRTYTLTRQAGAIVFTMVEVFSGLMLPMIAGSLPDFSQPFEQYAADLKRESERA